MIIFASVLLVWIICSLLVLLVAVIEHKRFPTKIFTRSEIDTMTWTIMAGPFGLIAVTITLTKIGIQKMLMKMFY